MDGVRGHQLFSLCGPGGATSNLVVDSMILAAKRSAVWQQTVIIIPKVDISALCEPLCGVRRCRHMRTGAPGFPLWMICGANPAVVRVFRRLFPIRLLRTAQLRVAKSPNHSAEIEEKRAHDHDHERVGLYHGFGDWRCHLFWMRRNNNRCQSVRRRDRQCDWRYPATWLDHFSAAQLSNVRHRQADSKWALLLPALSLNKMYSVSSVWSNTKVKL